MLRSRSRRKTRLSASTLTRVAIVAVALAAVLAGHVGGADISRATSSQAAASDIKSSGASASTTLKPSSCATEALTKLGASCYEFTGEENWDHPNGKTVTLPVAVLSNAETNPLLEPVFFFPGGPGSSAIDSENSIRNRLATVTPRPLVLVNSRGLLHAKPELQCPEYLEINHQQRQFAPDIFGLKGLDARIKQQADFVKACYRKLTNEGIDVTQYTDDQITRDYDEIRKALGYEAINIWGISTGGGTVESYLRYRGSHVRAAIFEVPWLNELRTRPPIDELYTKKQLVNDVLAICVRDNEECARRFPGYVFEVDRARAILDAKPYMTSVTTETGDRRKVRIDGTTFLSHVAGYGHFEFKYHLLPKALEAIKRGDYAALDEFFDLDDVDRIGPSTQAHGHMFAVMCGNMGKNRPTPKESLAMIKREPALMGDEAFPFCAWWGADGEAPNDLNTALVSDVPALAIHGQLDNCCSIRWNPQQSRTMPNLQRVEIQAQGHTQPQSACRAKLMSAFLDSPGVKVDDSCKDDIPRRPWVFYDG